MVSEEKLMRKIRKYNKKLERRRRSRRRSRDSERGRSRSSNRRSSDRERSPLRTRDTPDKKLDSRRWSKRRSHDRERGRSRSSNRRSSDRERSPLYTKTPVNQDETIPEIIPQNLVLEDQPGTQNIQAPEVEILDSPEEPNEELLQALGQEYEDNKKFEGKINNDICKRWNYILTHGLSKTEKDDILKLHNLPENCQLLDAPILNEEVGAVISEIGKTKDKCIAYQQKQMGTALTIVGKVMSNIINNTVDKISMLKSLSEAAKLMGDLHHQQTKTRRALVAPQLDKQFLEMTQNTTRNEFLYGENLSERIKVNKIIQQSSNSIKKSVPKTATTTKNTNNKYMGNRNGPPRQMYQRQPTKAMARGGPRTRPQPSHHQKTTFNPQRSERTRGAHYNNNNRK